MIDYQITIRSILNGHTGVVRLDVPAENMDEATIILRQKIRELESRGHIIIETHISELGGRFIE